MKLVLHAYLYNFFPKMYDLPSVSSCLPLSLLKASYNRSMMDLEEGE